MKVLILANSDSGLYHFRKELLTELLRDHAVVLGIPEGDYADDFRTAGCRLVPMQFDRHGINPIKELRLLKEYAALLNREKPDIVFTYTIKPNVYGGMACAALNIPYVANITGLGTAVENPGSLQLVTVMLYKLALCKAQMVFFQNTANQMFLRRKGVIRGSYDLLPGSGVNLEEYRLANYPRGETVNFLFISRVMKQKGIDQYLDAAKAIRKKHPDTRFHICGVCEQEYAGVLAELQEQGIIRYHGVVKNMAQMQKISACTIHPSFYPEGMSNVLLESCASGRPIITTDRPGCREAVEDGVNGFLIKQRDSGDLIEKIEKFLSLSWEQRRDMGLAGRVKVEREFDRRIVIDRYLEEVKKIQYGL